ncbi:unnamed protein product [Clonostachys rosea]|uniref:Uncharacterized protein n=1 Tax=Bionectria ochroleuca TaxID=29856 RepID=A0ABY6UGC5_BIOOC|nr:unnamed protein product [Clonostachys rosea]
MQFGTIFKEDVKQLRSVLATHVATINLILLTQVVASISAAEDDRDILISYLESKIFVPAALRDVNGRVDISLERQQEIKTQLRGQSSILDVLGGKADETRQQLGGQEASIREIQTIVNHTLEKTKSTLTTATEVLYRVTSGLIHLSQITKQLRMMIQLCTTLIIEMRAAMSTLMELFPNLQITLQQVNRNLPTRLYLPTV